MNSGDFAFLFTAAVVITLMTPAVAYFYGGLVHKKFTHTMLMQTFFTIPLITLVWSLVGFSLAYGGNILGGSIGGADFLFLRGLTDNTNNIWAPTVPFSLFFVVQLTFAIITPALISGALVARFRFIPYVIFFITWSLLVYSPLIHWVWGGGFLAKMGYLDFAGGLPVHLIAGFSSLAAVFAIGNREKREDGPSNMVYVAIGVGILWAGWLIFNASAALGANETAALAALNTLLASASGCIAWLLLAYGQHKKISVGDVVFGAFSGLVVSTPTSGFVSPWVMLPAGFIGGMLCYGAVALRIKRDWDDTLDVWALHGIGGLTGVLLLGIFANPDLAPAAGWLYGNPKQFFIEVAGLLIGTAYCVIVTYLLVKIINRFTPFRQINEEPEDF
ncbi:MAG TPA: ammonium transporter [Clostridiales bacterium]|nr:ammonium transporter [Clostridiales bacterium]